MEKWLQYSISCAIIEYCGLFGPLHLNSWTHSPALKLTLLLNYPKPLSWLLLDKFKLNFHICWTSSCNLAIIQMHHYQVSKCLTARLCKVTASVLMVELLCYPVTLYHPSLEHHGIYHNQPHSTDQPHLSQITEKALNHH